MKQGVMRSRDHKYAKQSVLNMFKMTVRNLIIFEIRRRRIILYNYFKTIRPLGSVVTSLPTDQ